MSLLQLHWLHAWARRVPKLPLMIFGNRAEYGTPAAIGSPRGECRLGGRYLQATSYRSCYASVCACCSVVKRLINRQSLSLALKPREDSYLTSETDGWIREGA